VQQAEGEEIDLSREYEGEINISPHACVNLLTEAQVIEIINGGTIEAKVRKPMADEVMIPVAPKSSKQVNAARRTALAVKKRPALKALPKALTGAAAAAKAKAAAGNGKKEPRTVRDCLCGCGEETMSYFVPGHDARFKGWMVKVERGEMEKGALPKPVQNAFKFIKRGEGWVTTTNYKGEKHEGYDTKR
jgi:hypothetical protein